jgi:adenylate kinase
VKVIVLLGAPGAGKGTQAPILSERLGLPHVATGDLFRAAVRDGSPVGMAARRYMERGQLVPDDITVRMLLERLDQPDARDGVILDGFPRNRAQAQILDAALAERDTGVDRAVAIQVPSEDLVARLSGRWVCRASGHVYNDQTNPPKATGVCDLDGSELYQRDDDKAETIRARMSNTLDALAEVESHYAARGLLRSIDGRQSIADVTAQLLDAVSGRAATNGAA